MSPLNRELVPFYLAMEWDTPEAERQKFRAYIERYQRDVIVGDYQCG